MLVCVAYACLTLARCRTPTAGQPRVATKPQVLQKRRRSSLHLRSQCVDFALLLLAGQICCVACLVVFFLVFEQRRQRTDSAQQAHQRGRAGFNGAVSGGVQRCIRTALRCLIGACVSCCVSKCSSLKSCVKMQRGASGARAGR